MSLLERVAALKAKHKVEVKVDPEDKSFRNVYVDGNLVGFISYRRRTGWLISAR